LGAFERIHIIYLMNEFSRASQSSAEKTCVFLLVLPLYITLALFQSL
jgi:hypothetical protein